MKKKLLFSTCLGILSSAFASENIPTGIYGRFDIGYSMMPPANGSLTRTADAGYSAPTTSYTEQLLFINGSDVDLAMGYRANDYFFTELEASYLVNSIRQDINTSTNVNSLSSGQIKVYTIMWNFFVDYPNPTPFTPYIGAGAGYLRRNYNIQDEPANDVNLYGFTTTSIGYQFMCGTTYEISQGFSANLGYTYLTGPRRTQVYDNGYTTSTNNLSFSTNIVTLGLVYQFA